MKGFVQDIEDLAVKNDEFRRVLYTAKHCQLVVMALKPKEEIGAEVHTLDQFFRVEEGTGEAILDGVRPDGRSYTDIRPITSEVSILPRVHGSSVFFGTPRHGSKRWRPQQRRPN